MFSVKLQNLIAFHVTPETKDYAQNFIIDGRSFTINGELVVGEYAIIDMDEKTVNPIKHKTCTSQLELALVSDAPYLLGSLKEYEIHDLKPVFSKNWYKLLDFHPDSLGYVTKSATRCVQLLTIIDAISDLRAIIKVYEIERKIRNLYSLSLNWRLNNIDNDELFKMLREYDV